MDRSATFGGVGFLWIPVPGRLGWSVPVEVGRSKFFINIGLMDEPSEAPTWLVWVESRGLMSRLFRSRNAGPQTVLCQRLGDILASASEISHVQWSAA